MRSNGVSGPRAGAMPTSGPDAPRRSYRRSRARSVTGSPSWSTPTAATRRAARSRAGGCLSPEAWGLSRPWMVAAMAASAGLPCTPHSANLSLVTICTMHLLGAIPNAGKYLEFSIEGPDYYPWQQGLFLGDPFAIRDGRIAIPNAPGWGVEIDPAWLEKAAYEKSEQA